MATTPQRVPASRDHRWHPPIIAEAVSSYPECVYIEIGTHRGHCINHVARHSDYCELHGVDVQDFREHLDDAVRFWMMPSDDFAERYGDPASGGGAAPHVVFIDGEHTYAQAGRDLWWALGALAPGGTIFIHDTWPLTTDDTQPGVCGDVYRLREELEAGEVGEVFTHERFPGLTVVRPRE